MLGVISEHTRKMSLLVTKSLKVLEETLYKHEEDVNLLEAIISCLTRLVPLLDQTCEVKLTCQPFTMSPVCTRTLYPLPCYQPIGDPLPRHQSASLVTLYLFVCRI